MNSDDQLKALLLRVNDEAVAIKVQLAELSAEVSGHNATADLRQRYLEDAIATKSLQLNALQQDITALQQKDAERASALRTLKVTYGIIATAVTAVLGVLGAFHS